MYFHGTLSSKCSKDVRCLVAKATDRYLLLNFVINGGMSYGKNVFPMVACSDWILYTLGAWFGTEKSKDSKMWR